MGVFGGAFGAGTSIGGAFRSARGGGGGASSGHTPRPIAPGGDPFGTHRVVRPKGVLPQPAERLDNDLSRIFAGELLIDVETLNIDAASFRQMEEVSANDDELKQRVVDTVEARGKQHNPVTGSGGMLLGRVLQVAPDHPHAATLAAGTRIATLVSLSLTPLVVRNIRAIRRVSAQMDIEGEAILFATGAYAVMPPDFPERLALALFDVAGAAPQVARLVAQKDTVLVLGAGGKSGMLCVAEAKRAGARVIGVESHAPFARELEGLGLCERVLVADARDPLAVRRAVLEANAGREVDVAFSCVNVSDAEMAAILCTRARGRVYFFAMSTAFGKAALGAEGVGKDVDLYIGNGYAEGHAEHTLGLVRSQPKIRALFEARYG